MISVLKRTDDCLPRVHFKIGSNLIILHNERYRNRSVKVVGMSGPETRNRLSSLRPGGGVFGMRVGDAADCRIRPVQDEMSRQIRRWLQFPFHYFAVEICNNHMFRFHFFVGDATRFNHNELILARDPADIAEGVEHQPMPHQFKVRLKHLFTQALQQYLRPAAIFGSNGRKFTW